MQNSWDQKMFIVLFSSGCEEDETLIELTSLILSDIGKRYVSEKCRKLAVATLTGEMDRRIRLESEL